MWKLRNFVFRILRPSFWLQNQATCWSWDGEIYRFLADPDEIVLRVGKYHAKVGPYYLWVANYPYASGYRVDDANELLPSPITRKLLQEKVAVARPG